MYGEGRSQDTDASSHFQGIWGEMIGLEKHLDQRNQEEEVIVNQKD